MWFNLFILIIETLFFIIPLIKIKEIKSKKKVLAIYFSIFIISIICDILLDKSIFKYLFLALLIFVSLKIIVKDTVYYDFFMIIIEMVLKTVIEYLCVICFYKIFSYNVFVILMELISLTLIILLNNFINKFYKITFKRWNGRHKFYFRYILLILFNSFIIFVIYNLILIRGGA